MNDTPLDRRPDTLDYDRPPFVMVPVGLVRAPATCLRLYVALGAYANGRTGGGAFPGVDRLAADLDLDRRTIQRALGWLREAGWLDVEERHRDDGGQTSNAYRLRSSPAGGAASMPQGGAAQMPQGGRHERRPNQNQDNQKHSSPTARSASRSAPTPGTDVATTALPGMPAPAERRDGGALVAAWCRGYTDARGRQPLKAEVQRVGRSARALAGSAVEWEAAVECAYTAGGRGRLDLVAAWTDAPPATGSTRPSMQGRLEAAMQRAMQAEQEGAGS